jgi:hypothetical protein
VWILASLPGLIALDFCPSSSNYAVVVCGFGIVEIVHSQSF